MTARPKLRTDVLQREVEQELLLYDPKSGETLLLNTTAAAIVDFCDGTHEPKEIATGIASLVADAEVDVVLADVEKTLGELRDKRMLAAEE